MGYAKIPHMRLDQVAQTLGDLSQWKKNQSK